MRDQTKEYGMADNDNNDLVHQLLLEYFKTLRGEIHLRLAEHHKLWLYKIAASGALLSFCLSSQGLGRLAIVMTPLVALLFDFLIVNNLAVIDGLGAYIKTHIEDDLFPHGWESISRDRYITSIKHSWVTDVVLILCYTSAIICLSTYAAFHMQLSHPMIYGAVAVSVVLLIVVMVYPSRHITILSDRPSVLMTDAKKAKHE